MKIRVSDLFSIADFRKLLFVGFASFVVRWIEIGRGERIRTSGLYVPNVALYQAKLHPDGVGAR
jgi:hypothetical protein